MIHLGVARPKQRGAGAWKLWLPRSLLRVAFGELSTNTRAVARKMQSNHAYIRKVRAAIAQSMWMLQQRRLREIVSQPAPYIVLNVLWDETKMAVKLKNESVANSSILCSHGLVRYVDAQGHRREEEVILPPVALQSTTADACLGGIQHCLPQGLQDVFANSQLGCLQITSDAASSNHLIVKHLATRLPANIGLLYHRCFQHQAHLCITFATMYLAFLGKLFATARVLSDAHHLRRLRVAARRVLEQKLERRVCQPSEENAQRMSVLIDSCYLQGTAGTHCKNKLETAKLLKKAFSGDIRVSDVIVRQPQ